MSDTRLISREATLKVLEDLHDGAIDQTNLYEAIMAVREIPIAYSIPRQSLCSSCGRTQPSDPTSTYFVAAPDKPYDSDWCGCERGAGT